MKTKNCTVLELKAVLFGLKSLCNQIHDTEILIRTDNTTTVSYINRMRGSKSKECQHVAKQIWQFCEDRELFLLATYIPGKSNEHADFISRNFTENTEWVLSPQIFQKICQVWGTPQVDMFASRLNHKVPSYISWVRDSNAIDVDAFSVDWNKWNLIYLFPPFSLVNKCIRRIKRTKGNVILVVPNWPGQSWYAQLRKPLVKDKMTFPPRKGNLLPQESYQKTSPLVKVPMLAVLC